MVYVKSFFKYKAGKTYKYRHYYTHRQDPVPHTGYWNASKRGCYRKIRTTQERKANSDLEICQMIRLKRRKMKSAWDDIPYSDWKHNCWKKSTKKKRQWMR